MDQTVHPRGPDMLYELVAGLGLPRGTVALDVGCGQGGHAIELALRFRLRVRGLDPLPSHVEAAQRRRANAAGGDEPELSELVSFGPSGSRGHAGSGWLS